MKGFEDPGGQINYGDSNLVPSRSVPSLKRLGLYSSEKPDNLDPVVLLSCGISSPAPDSALGDEALPAGTERGTQTLVPTQCLLLSTRQRYLEVTVMSAGNVSPSPGGTAQSTH